MEATHNHREGDVNEEEESGEEEEDNGETIVWKDSGCLVLVKSLSLSLTLRLDPSRKWRLAVFPVSLACIIVDIRTRNTRIA